MKFEGNHGESEVAGEVDSVGGEVPRDGLEAVQDGRLLGERQERVAVVLAAREFGQQKYGHQWRMT